MMRLVTGLILAWLLSGCAALGLRPPVPDLPMLPVAPGPGPALLKQSVSLVTASRQRTFLSVLRISDAALHGTVMLPSGQSLLTYRYVDNRLTVTSQLKSEVPLRQFLAIMQFSLWPEAALRRQYTTQSGWTLRLKQGERDLQWHGEPVLHVTATAGKLDIQQFDKGYRIVVDTLTGVLSESRSGTDLENNTDKATQTRPSL